MFSKSPNVITCQMKSTMLAIEIDNQFHSTFHVDDPLNYEVPVTV